MSAQIEPSRGPHRGSSIDAGGPLYEQCADRLADEIRQGRLRPGAHLPSERALAEDLGFTRLTVRRALSILAEDGALEPARRGWRVADGPVSEPPNTLLSFTEMAERRGLIATAHVLDVVIRPASVDEAESLRVAPGSLVIEGRRVRLLNDEPIAIETLRVSIVTNPWMAEYDWHGSLHAAFASQGVAARRSTVLVDVVAADETEAALLGVEPRRGLLRLSGTTFDGRGTPLSLDSLRYHPDRYRFRATLDRNGGSGLPATIPYIGGSP